MMLQHGVRLKKRRIQKGTRDIGALELSSRLYLRRERTHNIQKSSRPNFPLTALLEPRTGVGYGKKFRKDMHARRKKPTESSSGENTHFNINIKESIVVCFLYFFTLLTRQGRESLLQVFSWSE
jgi:hypothetical protein